MKTAHVDHATLVDLFDDILTHAVANFVEKVLMAKNVPVSAADIDSGNERSNMKKIRCLETNALGAFMHLANTQIGFNN